MQPEMHVHVVKVHLPALEILGQQLLQTPMLMGSDGPVGQGA